MSPILLFALVVIFGLVIFLKLKASGIGGDLYKSKPLMTDNEREFFQRLKTALPDHHIFAQVSLGALLQPNVKGDNRKYYSVRGTFAQKIADFVIADSDLKVVAIVELDDRTHNTDKDGKRDAMLEQAGYAVIRWHSKKKPTTQEIADRIAPKEKAQLAN